jgi:hypothetical protein
MIRSRALGLDVMVAEHAVDGTCGRPQRCDHRLVSHIASVQDGRRIHFERENLRMPRTVCIG